MEELVVNVERKATLLENVQLQEMVEEETEPAESAMRKVTLPGTVPMLHQETPGAGTVARKVTLLLSVLSHRNVGDAGLRII